MGKNQGHKVNHRGNPKGRKLGVTELLVIDMLGIFVLALVLRLVPDFMEPPHVATDPDFWYYYMAAKEPAWFHQLYGVGQPLATTYFAAVAAFFSGLFRYSLAMTMKIGFALVDSASALGLYLTGRQLYNRKAGILSGIAYAVSAQAIQGSALKVRHDGFAVALVVFSGYTLARLSSCAGKKLYFPLTDLRVKSVPYLAILAVLIYAAHLLTFYQFLVVVGVVGAFFMVSEVIALIDERKAIHVVMLAIMAVVAAYGFIHYDVAYFIGWSISSSSFIIELAPFSPIYALEWLNLFLIFVPFGIYFALKNREALSLSLFLITAPLYYLALRGILYFIIPVALSFGISLRGVRLKKTLAAFVLIVAAINVGIYYNTFPAMVQDDGTTEAQYKAALWIRGNSPGSALVLANWDRGHLIQAVAERNVVWAGQYVPSIGQIVSEAMYSIDESSSLHYLKELGSPTYIFLVQGTLIYYPSQQMLTYITGIGSPPSGFNISLVPRTVLYRMLYDPSSLADFREVYSSGGVYVFEVNYAD
ncbi:MAG: hypothetical protein ACP5SK_04975 [Thermoprotei archaeon]